MQNKRYQSFVQNLAQDALFFVFLGGVLTVYRSAFLFLFRDTLSDAATWQQIALTLWYGFRISLKTAGACVLPTFVLATLVETFYAKWPGFRVRWYWACAVLAVLSFLFQARIPYYHEFHNAFSPFIFNTFNDDVGAIVSTSIQEYKALWRAVAGVGCSVVWCVACFYWFKWFTPLLSRPLLRVRRRWLAVVLIWLFLIPFAVFVRWGGSFAFNGSIYWKNAARMDQHVLNEAIVDDIQALYRASRIYKKLAKASSSVTQEEVRQAAAHLTRQEVYTQDSLLPLLERTASGIQAQKPQHIFVIVAETYMLWPLLDQYRSLPLATGMRRIVARPDAVLVKHFLPASDGTMFGITSVLLGIPELNLQVASRPSAQQPFETALSTQLREQGYKTRFFYGGYPSWENIGIFMNNQLMEESFYAADFDAEGNVWGVADREFLGGITPKIGPEPSFNLILTSSNHPPYKVDQSREPQLPSVEEMEAYVKAGTTDRKLIAARMWHFAYADKYLAEFVEKILTDYPNSLVVITGDHADRWTWTNSPSDYERIAVPLILVGPQIRKFKAPKNAVGSHMDIAATILELILPKGTPYYALGENILRRREGALPVGVAAYYWMTPQVIGRADKSETEVLPGEEKPLESSLKAARNRVQDIQKIAAWRVLKGLEIK